MTPEGTPHNFTGIALHSYDTTREVPESQDRQDTMAIRPTALHSLSTRWEVKIWEGVGDIRNRISEDGHDTRTDGWKCESIRK